MKKALLTIGGLLFALLIYNDAVAQTTYTWNQTGTADWTIAANWTPARTVPATNDILQFTNSGIFTVTNVPTQTVGQLKVTAGTVNLQAGLAGNILTISGGTGDDLTVLIGADLNITSANTLTIFVASGANGLLTGFMTLSGGPHRLDAADAGGIVFASPAVFNQAAGCSGNVFTTSGTNNAIVFNTGTTFYQNDGDDPFGKPEPASKMVLNTGNLFIYQVGSGSPSFSGRTYANFQIANSGAPATVTGTSAVSIDNLTVNGGTLNFNMTGNPGHSIKGNITVAAIGVLNFNPASPATINLNGAAAQSITNSGTLSFGTNAAVAVNNSNGITLNSPVTIANTLTMTSGHVTIGNNNLIVNNISGGSPTSYIITNGTGKVTRQNISSLVLIPVGTTTTFNPLTIGNGSNIGSLDYSVKVDVGFTAAAVANANLAINRTWYISSSATPTGTVIVGFYYTGTPATDAGSLFSVAPATVDHGVFLPLGYGWNINQTGLTQVPAAGMYVASTSVSSFFGTFDFPMVIGNLGAVLATNNRTIDLTVQKQNSKAQLNWTLNIAGTVKEVVIQRSSDGRNFETLATVPALVNSFTDDKLLAGTNFYRIKLTDANGKITYSAIAAVINSDAGFDIVSLMPNIVRSSTLLNIAAAKKTQLNVVVTDMAGRPVTKQLYSLAAGSNIFDMNMAALPAGMYYLTASTAAGEVRTIRFVKQ